MADQINVDDIVERFTHGQLTVCAHRAAMKLNYEVEMNPDGSINPDELAEAVKLHNEADEFLEAYTQELLLMAAAQTTAELAAKGYIYEDGVNEDGEIVYRAVPEV